MNLTRVWALILAMGILAGCVGTRSPVPSFPEGSGNLKVAASFYPVFDSVRAVGGDKVDVVNLVPPGTEAHSWEPTAKHIKLLNEAAVFVYNGAGMEPWVGKVLRSLDNKTVVTVESAKGLKLLEAAPGKDGGHGHVKENSAADPHIWLDPFGKIHQVERIRDSLIQADPANKALYEANAAGYIGELKKLHEEFQSGLSDCKTREFFTSHAAFSYLADRYGLEQHAIMGLSPEEEPKPKELARIVKEAREHQVKYIFFETLVSPKVANVVAAEVGAKTLVLNPLEGLTNDEEKAGKTYASVMRENLANLRTALECR